MSRQKWFDKKFQFGLSQDEYELILSKLNENPHKIFNLVSSLPVAVLTKKMIMVGQFRKMSDTSLISKNYT